MDFKIMLFSQSGCLIKQLTTLRYYLLDLTVPDTYFHIWFTLSWEKKPASGRILENL